MKIDGINITIEVYETLGGTPAKCTIVIPHKEAIIKIAKDHFSGFDKQTKMFVILHELGHAVCNSGDEEEVDRWAYKQYVKTGLPLKGAVYALSKVLDPLNHEPHSARVTKQFYRSKHTNFLRGNTSWRKFKNQKIT